MANIEQGYKLITVDNASLKDTTGNIARGRLKDIDSHYSSLQRAMRSATSNTIKFSDTIVDSMTGLAKFTALIKEADLDNVMAVLKAKSSQITGNKNKTYKASSIEDMVMAHIDKTIKGKKAQGLAQEEIMRSLGSVSEPTKSEKMSFSFPLKTSSVASLSDKDLGKLIKKELNSTLKSSIRASAYEQRERTAKEKEKQEIISQKEADRRIKERNALEKAESRRRKQEEKERERQEAKNQRERARQEASARREEEESNKNRNMEHAPMLNTFAKVHIISGILELIVSLIRRIGTVVSKQSEKNTSTINTANNLNIPLGNLLKYRRIEKITGLPEDSTANAINAVRANFGDPYGGLNEEALANLVPILGKDDQNTIKGLVENAVSGKGNWESAYKAIMDSVWKKIKEGGNIEEAKSVLGRFSPDMVNILSVWDYWNTTGLSRGKLNSVDDFYNNISLSPESLTTSTLAVREVTQEMNKLKQSVSDLTDAMGNSLLGVFSGFIATLNSLGLGKTEGERFKDSTLLRKDLEKENERIKIIIPLLKAKQEEAKNSYQKELYSSQIEKLEEAYEINEVQRKSINPEYDPKKQSSATILTTADPAGGSGNFIENWINDVPRASDAHIFSEEEVFSAFEDLTMLDITDYNSVNTYFNDTIQRVVQGKKVGDTALNLLASALMTEGQSRLMTGKNGLYIDLGKDSKFILHADNSEENYKKFQEMGAEEFGEYVVMALTKGNFILNKDGTSTIGYDLAKGIVEGNKEKIRYKIKEGEVIDTTLEEVIKRDDLGLVEESINLIDVLNPLIRFIKRSKQTKKDFSNYFDEDDPLMNYLYQSNVSEAELAEMNKYILRHAKELGITLDDRMIKELNSEKNFKMKHRDRAYWEEKMLPLYEKVYENMGKLKVKAKTEDEYGTAYSAPRKNNFLYKLIASGFQSSSSFSGLTSSLLMGQVDKVDRQINMALALALAEESNNIYAGLREDLVKSGKKATSVSIVGKASDKVQNGNVIVNFTLNALDENGNVIGTQEAKVPFSADLIDKGYETNIPVTPELLKDITGGR